MDATAALALTDPQILADKIQITVDSMTGKHIDLVTLQLVANTIQGIDITFIIVNFIIILLIIIMTRAAARIVDRMLVNHIPRVVNRVEVKMDDKEKALYDKFRQDMVLKLPDGELDAVNAAALSNKLIQMADGAVYGDDKKVLRIHDRKLDALEDIIEAANGKPLLVAYWYKHDRDRIRARFDTRDIDTKQDIDDWCAGKIPVALIHPASAGHGLNLQDGGSSIVWFGLTWSLEMYQQLNARLWRQGQKNTVVIQHIITAGTHDEDVIRALELKDTNQNALINAVRARIGGAA